MPMFLVRCQTSANPKLHGDKALVGLFMAEHFDDLFKMIDEEESPTHCEYLPISPPVGFHIDATVSGTGPNLLIDGISSTYHLDDLIDAAMATEDGWMDFDDVARFMAHAQKGIIDLVGFRAGM